MGQHLFKKQCHYFPPYIFIVDPSGPQDLRTTTQAPITSIPIFKTAQLPCLEWLRREKTRLQRLSVSGLTELPYDCLITTVLGLFCNYRGSDNTVSISIVNRFKTVNTFTNLNSNEVFTTQGMRQEFGSAGAGASWRALVLKTVGAHSTRSLKISGCKR